MFFRTPLSTQSSTSPAVSREETLMRGFQPYRPGDDLRHSLPPYHSNIIENILKHLKSLISVIAFSKNIHPSMMEANSSKSHMRLSISYNGVR
jgi:hypothetical protein